MLISDGKMMKSTDKERTQATRCGALATGIFAAGAIVAATSNAQSQESVLVDVGACVNLEARRQVIACYEDRVAEVLQAREAERAANEPAPAAAPVTPPEIVAPPEPRVVTASAPAQADRRETGRAETRQRNQRVAPTTTEEPNDTPREFVAIVSELREIEPNAYMIYLDNGQVWRQSEPKRYQLRAGAEVQLRATRWGTSYRLSDPNLGSFIQVDRIR